MNVSEQISTQTKQCLQCQKIKPLSLFNSNGWHGGDGRQKVCCACLRINSEKARSLVISKKCFTCHEEKPASEFSNRFDSKDGLCSSCIPCSNKRQAERNYARDAADKKCS
jgi:hypothetical protein